jgi:hypothetical protein
MLNIYHWEMSELDLVCGDSWLLILFGSYAMKSLFLFGAFRQVSVDHGGQNKARRWSAAHLPLAALTTTRDTSTKVAGARKKLEKVSNQCVCILLSLTAACIDHLNSICCCVASAHTLLAISFAIYIIH